MVLVWFIDEVKIRKNVFFGFLLYFYIAGIVTGVNFLELRKHGEALMQALVFFLIYILIMAGWRKIGELKRDRK